MSGVLRVVLLRVALLAWLITGFNVVQASSSISGSFVASRACDAYVSKNKHSNPDHARLIVDHHYSLVEANKKRHPDWYRVRVESASPSLRWVNASCGRVSTVSNQSHASEKAPHSTVSKTSKFSGDACHIAGRQDSYVLALSWQPAFCESHRAKPECRIKDKSSYQASHFTLHGLWPNQASCGIHYEFCDTSIHKQNSFCSYPALPLSMASRRQLERVMPSAAQGSCLQRHEWFKHGTCQSNLAIDAYFSLAVSLTRQFNDAGVSDFMSSHIGKTVTESAFKAVVDAANGGGAHNTIKLGCRKGMLTDVWVYLPASLKLGDSLDDLMKQTQQAPHRFSSNCGGRFKIDPI